MPIDESSDDSFENSFALALRTAADVSPERGTEALALGAARRGQRRKRRRNALAGATTLAVLVACGSAATAWLTPRAATTVTSTATVTTGPSPSPTPGATTASPAGPVSDAQLLTTFSSLLPPSWSLGQPASQGTEPHPAHPDRGAYASATVDDGHGKAFVEVTFRRGSTPVDMSVEWMQCPDKTAEPYTVCSRTTRADGSTLLVLQRYRRPDRQGGFQQWSAVLLRPDGTVLTLIEDNTATISDSQLTRVDPPLTAAQLAALATDPRWDPVLATLPAPNVPPSGGFSGDPMKLNFNWPSTDKILATAGPLLPAGLTESDTGGTDFTAHFTVDDGHGKSLTEVSVQDWSVFKPGVSSGADITSSFRGATALPDGTLVMRSTEKDYSDEKGLVRNHVDILRPDHLRIIADSFNSTAPALAPTRALPTLTLDQLQALATSASWESAKN